MKEKCSEDDIVAEARRRIANIDFLPCDDHPGWRPKADAAIRNAIRLVLKLRDATPTAVRIRAAEAKVVEAAEKWEGIPRSLLNMHRAEIALAKAIVELRDARKAAEKGTAR
jgi:hypothetical protein